MFNIITRKTLLEYAKAHPEAANALYEWYHEILKCDFKNFNGPKKKYGNASIVDDDRVVFKVGSNNSIDLFNHLIPVSPEGK